MLSCSHMLSSILRIALRDGDPMGAGKRRQTMVFMGNRMMKRYIDIKVKVGINKNKVTNFNQDLTKKKNKEIKLDFNAAISILNEQY